RRHLGRPVRLGRGHGGDGYAVRPEERAVAGTPRHVLVLAGVDDRARGGTGRLGHGARTVPCGRSGAAPLRLPLSRLSPCPGPSPCTRAPARPRCARTRPRSVPPPVPRTAATRSSWCAARPAGGRRTARARRTGGGLLRGHGRILPAPDPPRRPP